VHRTTRKRQIRGGGKLVNSPHLEDRLKSNKDMTVAQFADMPKRKVERRVTALQCPMKSNSVG
jgi:hypothetical protein